MIDCPAFLLSYNLVFPNIGAKRGGVWTSFTALNAQDIKGITDIVSKGIARLAGDLDPTLHDCPYSLTPVGGALDLAIHLLGHSYEAFTPVEVLVLQNFAYKVSEHICRDPIMGPLYWAMHPVID